MVGAVTHSVYNDTDEILEAVRDADPDMSHAEYMRLVSMVE